MSNYVMAINYEYCTGCHACELSCRNEKELPLSEWGIKVGSYGPEKLEGEWSWDYIPVLSQLCNMCEERIAEGKLPACQLHCLASCIEVIPVEDASAKLAEMGPKTAVYMS